MMNLLESAGFSRANPYYVVQQGKVAYPALCLTLMRVHALNSCSCLLLLRFHHRWQTRQCIYNTY